MNNKVVVIARTRDEERNIGHFIGAYIDWVDEILIADGGSYDATFSVVHQIMQYTSKVRFREFYARVNGRGGVWKNHAGKQIRFLLDWAEERNADWVIFDDVDCRPNYLLKQDGRKIIEDTRADAIYVTRLHVWKDTGQHFSKLAKSGTKNYQQGLWAWRLDSPLDIVDDNPWDQKFVNQPQDRKRLELKPPYCLMHHPWPNEEMVQRKMLLYNNTYWADGEPRTFEHPLRYAGKLEDLPEWAHE